MNFKFSRSKTEWVKFASVYEVSFMSKSIACFASGCHILFYDLSTGEETIYRGNNVKIGDGIGRLVGHKTLKFFAFADKDNQPSIFIMSYPDMTLAVPPLRTHEAHFVSIVFSEAELLMALGGFPTYTIHVWKWKVGEKLLSVDTNLIYGHQMLRTNFTTPVLMSQCVVNTQHLILWEFAMCGSRCVMSNERVNYREPTSIYNFSQAIWTTDGGLFVLDVKGHLFTLGVGNKLDLVITWENEGDKLTFFAWYQNGFLIHGSNGEYKHYKKSGEWSSDWSLTTDYSITTLVAPVGKDYLVALSKDEDILLFDNGLKEFQLLRSDQSGITQFCLIYPRGEYMVTVAHHRKLFMWRVDTGELVEQIEFDDKSITKVNSNPYYPYFCATFDTGLLQMYTCIDDKLLHLANFQLCRLPMHKIAYSEMGTIIVTANMDFGYFFVLKGHLGGAFKILTSIRANIQVADYILVGTKPCLRLFLIPVTSDKYMAGNEIWRYCAMKNEEPTLKKYELENPERYYTRLYITWKAKLRDRMFYAVPMDSKNIHEMEVKRGDTHARVVDRFKSNHMMKDIAYKWNIDHVLSFAFDGIILAKDNNFKDIRDAVMPHHRKDGGVRLAFSDPHGRRIVSLGRDGVLVCTLLTDREENAKLALDVERRMSEAMKMMARPTIGFHPTGIYEGKSWLEYEDLIKIDGERFKYEKERTAIVMAMSKIRNEVSRLLTKNLTGPENEYLDLQEFNLDNAKKEERVRTSRELCELTKMHMQKIIAENERVAALIKQNFWDTIDEHTRNLWAIFGNFDVQSYCILSPDGEMEERMRLVDEYRKVEQMLSSEDMFAPWLCTTKEDVEAQLQMEPRVSAIKENRMSRVSNVADFEDFTDEEKERMKEQHMKELEQYTAFSGTTTHIFVDANQNHYTQFEQQTFNQHLWEIMMGQDDQQNLRVYFNKKFEETFQLKIREMGHIIEKNARLRYILSELNYFSVEQLDISLIDPEWRQDETPEKLIVVKNEEVGILPYISPSEQALLDAKAAEAERLRLLMLADDFKERALMAMMNGVLEIRWEDELRKDVPKPKCMLEKDPSEFNEEDLRAIRDYDEKVIFLNSERERYKVILTNEYAKVGGQIREGVRKFNEKMKELLLLKLQVESAIYQETLRANRLKKWDLIRIDAENEIAFVKNVIAENESKLEKMHKHFGKLHTFLAEIRNNLEFYQSKDKFIDKSFKKEFQDATSSQLEVLSKLYKKRPKSNIKGITSSCLLNELANCVVNNKKTVLLIGDALEFFKLLETLDKYVGIPLAVDANLYAQLCRQRRFKIENELRVRALQLDLAEAENTAQLQHKAVARAKEMTQQLAHKLDALRQKRLKSSANIELQVVLREGFVEIPRTGSLKDFKYAILISRNVVEDINKIIQETGLKKIKAMKSAMNFKNEILLMEWEHRKRKMEIVDLNKYLIDVGSINVTKEIQTYLKARARGDVLDKGISFDEEIENTKKLYMRMIDDKKLKIEKAEEELATLRAEYKETQKEISAINVDVNEFRLNINEKILKYDEKIMRLRMAAHMKRSKLITQIQENQQEIFVLQTELELLRLRTVPVLEYKVEV